MLIKDSFHNVPVLVTGPTGFIGYHLLEALISLGARPSVLSRRKSPSLSDEFCLIGDVTDRSYVLEAVSAVCPSYVFHLAANKNRCIDSEAFRTSFEQNLLGTLNLVEACEKLPSLKSFVAIGTCEEYGDSDGPYHENMREAPVSAYSCSKSAVTNLLQTYWRVKAFPVTILRPSLAYGPMQKDDMFLPCLIQALLKGERFPMSSGCQTRDFIYVEDLINAILAAACCQDARGEIINVCSGAPVRIKDLATMVADLVGKDTLKLLEIGKIENRPGEIMDYRPDNVKARKLLGWHPKVQLFDGLNRTIDFYRSQLS